MKVYTPSQLRLGAFRETMMTAYNGRLYLMYSYMYSDRQEPDRKVYVYSRCNDQNSIRELIESARQVSWIELLLTTGLTKGKIKTEIEYYDRTYERD